MESFAVPGSTTNGRRLDEAQGQALLQEFANFLRKYTLAKECFLHNHVLDAYSCIESALHHWARIVILEEGVQPEATIWEQAKRINPGVYKMYEELTFSNETIQQRIQLILLACEFSVMSKMERCCMPLLEVLQSRPEGWTTEELMTHPLFADLRIDMEGLIAKMVQKALIHRLSNAVEEQGELQEIRYVKQFT